jgi:hypothetical protein
MNDRLFLLVPRARHNEFAKIAILPEREIRVRRNRTRLSHRVKIREVKFPRAMVVLAVKKVSLRQRKQVVDKNQ